MRVVFGICCEPIWLVMRENYTMAFPLTQTTSHVNINVYVYVCVHVYVYVYLLATDPQICERAQAARDIARVTYRLVQIWRQILLFEGRTRKRRWWRGAKAKAAPIGQLLLLLWDTSHNKLDVRWEQINTNNKQNFSYPTFILVYTFWSTTAAAAAAKISICAPLNWLNVWQLQTCRSFNEDLTKFDKAQSAFGCDFEGKN